MSDRLTPPEKIPPDDWLKVQRLERDRLSKQEEESRSKDRNPKPLLFAAIAIHFKKVLQIIFPELSQEVGADEKQNLSDDLTAFKKKLQILGNEDQSRNPEFIQQLSALWHKLLENCNILNLSTKKNNRKFLQLKNLLDDINSFPPKEDHTLGYYLSEYVGAEWLPFPFMDMLQSLHAQHQKSPETSQITFWVQSINEILSEHQNPEETAFD